MSNLHIYISKAHHHFVTCIIINSYTFIKKFIKSLVAVNLPHLPLISCQNFSFYDSIFCFFWFLFWECIEWFVFFSHHLGIQFFWRVYVGTLKRILKRFNEIMCSCIYILWGKLRFQLPLLCLAGEDLILLWLLLTDGLSQPSILAFHFKVSKSNSFTFIFFQIVYIESEVISSDERRNLLIKRSDAEFSLL